MLSLLELIAQNQPHFQTHQALLVIGLQNDFIQPDGRLPVDTRSGFLDRVNAIIPKFRQLSANVIWIQTLYEADRMANDPASGEGDAVVVGGLVDGGDSSTEDDEDLPKDLVPPTQSRSSRHKQRALDLLKKVSTRRRTLPREEIQSVAEEDEELFLLRSSKRGPACLPDTPGAEFSDAVKPNIEQSDTILRTTNYSAFLGTSLLLVLRAKLVTELYICGCITNVSVLATVIDAARHGIKINVVVDCLGFRKQNRHDEALRRMVEFLDANIVTSREILEREQSGAPQQPTTQQNGSNDIDDNLENLVDRLRLSEGRPSSQSESSRHSDQYSVVTVNGRHRKPSDASAAESRTTIDTKRSDEQFAEKLVQGARVPNENQRAAASTQNLVKSKVRMRSRTDKRKKEEDKKTKTERSTKNQPTSRDRAEPPTSTSQPQIHPVEAGAEPPRQPTIVKAESSDKLRENNPKHAQSLKPSTSQPALSAASSIESKIKRTPSRVRLALSRSAKSDSNSNKLLPAQSQPSPTKITTDTLQQSPAQATIGEAPEKSPRPTIAEAPNTPTKTSTTANTVSMGKKLQSLATFPMLRPGDRIAEGDSRIIYDFFSAKLHHPTDKSKPLKDLIFQQLYNEVRWQRMLHQQGEVPRLVCCQGEFGADGSMPLYRHPTDQSLPLLHFSPKVEVIRRQAEKLVGHPLNHVLVQLYRSGNDYISEHSDKTLDIVKGSSIVNVSFGAQRTMRLRTKKSAKSEDSEEVSARNTQRVAMPHNSMFVLGLESNKKWLHGINADKRLEAERSQEEKAYSGIRISLTFRHIGTFLDAENSRIWGQGATSKDQRDAQEVINDDEDENEKMVRAFSRENHNMDFDWDEWYGDGFDVLHFRNAPEDLPILFASNNHVENKMLQVFFAESKLSHTILHAPPMDKHYELDRQVCFRDNDINHTETNIYVPILLYLDRYHPFDRDDRGRFCTSQSYQIFILISSMMKYWANRHVPTYYQDFMDTLEILEEKMALGPGPFICGRRFSIGDCGMWPAVDELISKWHGWSEEKFPALSDYYRVLWKKKKSIAQLRSELSKIRKTDAIEVQLE